MLFRSTIIRLEAEIKAKQATIDELHARPAPSTEREMYLLSEIEMIGRQFESEYSTLCRFLTSATSLIHATYHVFLLAAVSPDWQAENRRVDERVAPGFVTGKHVTIYQEF